jgi:hypothetical protein
MLESRKTVYQALRDCEAIEAELASPIAPLTGAV